MLDLFNLESLLGTRCPNWEGTVILPEFRYYRDDLGWVNKYTRYRSSIPRIHRVHLIYIQHDPTAFARCGDLTGEEVDDTERAFCLCFENSCEYGTPGASLSSSYTGGPEYCVGYRPAHDVARLGSFAKVRTCQR